MQFFAYFNKQFVYILSLSLALLIRFAQGSNTLHETSCDRSRQVFTQAWGVISDGPVGSNYTQDSHCEWLIKANNSAQYITLSFLSMGTECSYDYVFVYDGNSFSSPLLGSFSGKTEPQNITAVSGSMLILLYSDTNYVLGGFHAEFSITNCPGNCSGHGMCIGHKCICEGDWGGADCSYEVCPGKCGFAEGRGRCDVDHCVCSFGYSGQACSLSRSESIGNSWHWLSHTGSGFQARAAHTAVYINETDSLYVFGGYDLNSVLGDLVIYNFHTSSWTDEDGNLLVDSAVFHDPLDPNILGTVLEQVGAGEERWGIKPKSSIFHNILYSLTDRTLLDPKLHRSKRDFQNENKDIDETQEVNTTTDEIPLEELIDETDDMLFEPTTTINTIPDTENVPDRPSARYGHASCRHPGGFIVYGGKLTNGNLSDELWFYNVTEKAWSLRAFNSKLRPPKLTRHTITLVNRGVNKNYLYLFGGSSVGGEFSSKIFRITLRKDEDEEWEEVRPRGGKELDVRVVAHCTVYYPQSNSLLVYGGVMAGLARFSKLSDRMFTFHLDSRHWSEINYPRALLRDSYVPRERAFHTATVIGNYLVVYGGYSHRHKEEEICYDNQMYLYHLGCHTWVSHDVLPNSNRGARIGKHQGVFAHAADVRNGNTLLVVGGYHGNVNADLLAFVLPPMLARREGETFEPEQICSKHHTLPECTANPECGWCPTDEVCYGRTVGINCTTNLQTTRCPGVCPALGDCYSCLLHEQMPPAASVARKLRLGECTWCVQNAKCHHKDDNYGVCGLRDDTPSQIPGWWGPQGTEVTKVEECRVKDRRPGLTFLTYRHPANFSQPDSVNIINATTVDFETSKETRTEQNVSAGVITARLLGFLRTPDAWGNVNEYLRICASFSDATLKMSWDQHTSFPNKMLTVGNFSSDRADSCIPATWPPENSVEPTKSIILHPGRILVDLQARRTGPSQQSKIELQHQKGQESPKVFTFEFLEPYQMGSCGQYTNCLQCLSDSLCGWCHLNNKCLSREFSESQFCTTVDQSDWHYLTLQPSNCDNCSNYISCETCVGSELCEWWIEDARCSRKARAVNAIISLEQCPVPCHIRKNCSQCLDERGRCVWCEATQECFSFSVYTSEYQFGLCREWIDQVHNPGQYSGIQERGGQRCKSCSKHTTCSSCLHTLSCGWCFDVNNPIRGLCVPGDFDQPHIESCSAVLNGKYNESLIANDSSWAYAQCPDVNECDLKLDNCHKDAICTNTHGSFECKCKRGFNGDGHLSCTKTCYEKCIHGECSMAPDYKCNCNLGWTGKDCNTDCGCNFHATCSQGVGICDDCQEWTTGHFCQYCKRGSFGNATTEDKCKPCECNGHGDEKLGVCDIMSGVCFCRHNTRGDNCEKCEIGYYGDPRDNGNCYYQCVGRGMLTGLESRNIGSRVVEITPWSLPVRECLWIITPYDVDNKTNSANSIIQLSMHPDINVECLENNVYIYDGLPDFGSMASSHQSHALGSFCHRNEYFPPVVESKTGILTVHYKQGSTSQGFNATYTILSCPDNCPPNRQCRHNQCVCPGGFTGPNCTLTVCPKNCSAEFKQGICDKGYGRCICQADFGGSDCSVRLQDTNLVFTELFNSARLGDSYDHLRKMLPRFGHSLVTDRRGSLWMFGGYSLSHGPLNDIRLFDTKNNTWMQVTVDSTRDASMPQGRYFHAAEMVYSRREIYVYGGIADKGNIVGLTNNTLNDFWKFSVSSQRWIDVQTKIHPPSLAGHTLTLKKSLEHEILVLIGGISPKHGFLESVWEYNVLNNTWRTLPTTGNSPVGIYGHTTVYYSSTKSFYVFGGYLFLSNRTEYSNRLYCLHYPTLTWSVLPTFDEYNPRVSNLPSSRYLHSAITTDEYMLVFTGDALLAYSYSCNLWLNLLSQSTSVVGEIPPYTYGQAMTYDPETNMVYIVGGFDGTVASRVIRLSVPVDLCSLWVGKEKCRSFLGCSYCAVTRGDDGVSSFCYASTRSQSEFCDSHNGTLVINNGVVCDARWFEFRSCEQFLTCGECLAKWPGYYNESQVCKWCGGRCIHSKQNCSRDIVTEAQQCSELTCAASDCDKCESLQGCSWTRQPPTANWNCLEEENSARCPARCGDLKDCTSCLLASGGEGGWHECRWSTALRECISPSYQPLYCAGGVCGAVLKGGNIDQCPELCSSFKQCSTCLRHAHCGWCALEEGEGLCTEGSLDKPLERPALDTCEALLNQSSSWHYVTCPPENECLNDHHSCNNVSEVCVDLPRGYKCVCGSGYKFESAKCQPVCKQGCVRGSCVEPDKCVCDFGYVGNNCSIQCQCNGHSNCAGPDRLTECLECQNNTMGPQCERCRPLYVRDPSDHDQCIPCLDYCHGHTNVCVNATQLYAFSEDILLNFSQAELEKQLVEGPITGAKCIGCGNRTFGERCQECVPGNFRGSKDHRDVCRPCECHGHGDMCDPETGESCNCQNNTESDTSCQSSLSKNSNQQCWMLQCSKCKETFSGTPTDRHQCYKQMTLDHKFCLDSKLIEDCGKPRPLHPGQAVFFQVQPRYVNVDIRVIVDVTQGSLDLYMSPRDDSLVVTSNFTHPNVVEWDPKFGKMSSVENEMNRVRLAALDLGGNVTSLGDQFLVWQPETIGLSTYVTVAQRNTFLHVGTVKDRLVLTLPKDTYDLVSTRFYLALVAGSNTTAPTYGMIFFRQDQQHIDLFVFFSVFFSCFFLFLAACVVAWKAKQTADLRRARRRHVVEMLTMAKRPFATITLLMDNGIDTDTSQSPHRKKKRHASGDIRPIAIEPTDDGLAAVGTVFVKLPGGQQAPVRLALASSLVMMSRMYPINSRVFLRRRSSHHVPP